MTVNGGAVGRGRASRMSEEQAIYEVDEEKEPQSVAQTWTVHLVHVGMVSDLVARKLAKNNSAAARMLITAGYAAINEKTATA